MAFWTGGPHPTSNLAGYPARDFGAPGGTPVYAWSTLRVERISGAPGYRGGGFGGLNLYLRDRFGGTYFMTHVENVKAKVGDVLRPGQPLAVVGPYGTPHVHLGYTGGDPVSTLGFRPEFLYTAGGAVAGSTAIDESAKRGRLIPSLASGKQEAGGLKIPFRPGVPGLPGVLGEELPGIIGRVPGVGGPASDFWTAANAIPKSIQWVFENWDRALEVLGGVLLVIIGLVLMGRSLGVTKTRIELVERNLPGGTERVVERQAARAEERAYVRSAASAGRRRATGGSPEPRRRRVRPLDAEPRVRPTSQGPSEDIPF